MSKRKKMQHHIGAGLLILSFAAVFSLHSGKVSALDAGNSSSHITGEITVTASNSNTYQNQVFQLQQAFAGDILQADQIDRSLLAQYKHDDDLIVGTYNYGSLMGIKLTKQQAEIIKNGYIPILGKPGDAPTVNKNPKTNTEYVEIDGGSGGRSITACYNPNVPRKPGENQVLVKGSMYGSSNGGYVCADPDNIRANCSLVSDSNPCLSGMFQLDNAWLLSIGVDTAEIRRKIDAFKNPTPPPQPPVQPSVPPAPPSEPQ